MKYLVVLNMSNLRILRKQRLFLGPLSTKFSTLTLLEKRPLGLGRAPRIISNTFCSIQTDPAGRQAVNVVPLYLNIRYGVAWSGSHFYSTHANDMYKEKGNIILMGSPGAGKTTIGRLLADKLNKPVIDIDNDYLKQHWKMDVAEKLGEVGSDGFVQAEGEALQQFNASGSVVSLSGSNPMHAPGMEHVKKSGLVIYVDVPDKDILSRLERMKVARIVGQEIGTPMTDILPYRKQFYERYYDLRILCEPYESAESIAAKIYYTLKDLEEKPGFVSTREDMTKATFRTFNEVVLEGLAWDGGLYVPVSGFPYFTNRQWSRLVPLSYPERALRILEQWLHPLHLHPSDIRKMVENTYNTDNYASERIFPVEKLDNGHTHIDQYVLELFHGPSGSFKDAALQLTPKFFHHALLQRKSNADERYMILVATSGDTGGAVLDGFKGSSIKVLVLYPEDGISSLQKAQMTAADGDNVRVIGVKSDFDFCQTTIKKIFNDQQLVNDIRQNYNCRLSAANSINWGRLLPQVVYQASAYLELVQRKRILMGQPVDLCVPTGNFGNMLGAFYAKKMGIPYRHLICASNTNNVLTEFVNTGCYNLNGRTLRQTAAPAIDILKSSNLERLLYHITGGDHNKVSDYYKSLETQGSFKLDPQDFVALQDTVKADWCVEQSCLKSIVDTYRKTGYLMDPHTAIAKVVADKFPDGEVPMIINSTAHHAKFAPEVLMALGHSTDQSTTPTELFGLIEQNNTRPDVHQILKEGILRPRLHHRVIEAHVSDIVREVKEFLSL